MYCKNCGAQLNDQDTYCAQCGTSYQSQSIQDQVTNSENGHWLWGLLGFCIPVVGLVLFIVWKDTKPKAAKSAGIGALLFVIIKYILVIFLGGMAGLFNNNMWF